MESSTSFPSEVSPEVSSCQICRVSSGRPSLAQLYLAWDARFDSHGVVDHLRILCDGCAGEQPGKFCTWPLEDAENTFWAFELSNLHLTPKARRQLDEIILALQQESGEDESTGE